MAKTNEFCDYLMDRLAPLGTPSYKFMFGGYGIYLDGREGTKESAGGEENKAGRHPKVAPRDPADRSGLSAWRGARSSRPGSACRRRTAR